MTRPLDQLTVDELDALADEPCGYVIDLDAAPVGYMLTADAEATLRREQFQLVTS